MSLRYEQQLHWHRKRIEKLEAELAASEKIEGVIRQVAQERIEELEAELAEANETIVKLLELAGQLFSAWRKQKAELIKANALIDRVVAWDNHAGKESIIEIARDMRKAREVSDGREKRHGE